MIAALVALALAAGGVAAAGGAGFAAASLSADPGYRFARSLALAGARPAGSAAERRAHARVAARFRAAGLRVEHDRFRVPGHGRSRNVVGIRDTAADCLAVLVAHADSVPPRGGRTTTPRGSAHWWRSRRGSPPSPRRATCG